MEKFQWKIPYQETMKIQTLNKTYFQVGSKDKQRDSFSIICEAGKAEYSSFLFEINPSDEETCKQYKFRYFLANPYKKNHRFRGLQKCHFIEQNQSRLFFNINYN